MSVCPRKEHQAGRLTSGDALPGTLWPCCNTLGHVGPRELCHFVACSLWNILQAVHRRPWSAPPRRTGRLTPSPPVTAKPLKRFFSTTNYYAPRSPRNPRQYAVSQLARDMAPQGRPPQSRAAYTLLHHMADRMKRNSWHHTWFRIRAKCRESSAGSHLPMRSLIFIEDGHRAGVP